MTTAAIYARFSSEKQSEASIDDQVRLCEARAAILGIPVTIRRSDSGVSGSTPVRMRPGGRALLADAMAGRIDVLLVESLDRISRDQVDMESTIRSLEHRQVRIVSVSDGYDSQAGGRKVLRTIRGLGAEMYLDDLRDKTHRGLTGRVLAGYSAGGRSYGYRSEHDGHGHRLVVDAEQAQWVRWIFARFALDGWSTQRIAHSLNEQRVPAPRSGSWVASCIYGTAAAGTGLLNNQLYIGRMIWNRRQWIKDPDTGARKKFDRPESEWQVRELPELRIVDDALWQATRARMDRPRRAGGWGGKGAVPRTLFGGLLRCGKCGGALVATSAHYYSCAARKDRGTAVCTGVSAPREATDRRLLGLVRDDLLSPAAMAQLQREIAEQLSSTAAARRQARRARAGRLDELRREIDNLVRAVAAAGDVPALVQRLRAADAERAALEADDDTAPGAADVTVAQVLTVYRELLMDLERTIDLDRERARQLLTQIIGRVSIVREDRHVWADVEVREPARLLVAGSTLGAVAGTGFSTRRMCIR